MTVFLLLNRCYCYFSSIATVYSLITFSLVVFLAGGHVLAFSLPKLFGIGGIQRKDRITASKRNGVFCQNYFYRQMICLSPMSLWQTMPREIFTGFSNFTKNRVKRNWTSLQGLRIRNCQFDENGSLLFDVISRILSLSFLGVDCDEATHKIRSSLLKPAFHPFLSVCGRF